MKKILFLLLIANAMFANAQSLSGLRNERAFKDYVSSEYNLVKNANEADISLVNPNLLSNGDQAELRKFLAAIAMTESGYRSHLATQRSRLSSLEAKYKLSTIPSRQLQDLLIPELNPVIEPIIAVTNGDCEDELQNTLIMNFAAAVLGHLTCSTADITVFAGIICHGAVATVHATADANARIEYKRCIKNQKK
ncbi:hypothetical protein CHX27_08550 [Flavobacterium aurantiibacter]|uniref:Uncharacterized protein n=2 Tax=Flavobacterium aurantiibacter TaxID=2023067 RepID=A0A255ZSR1_9FLAO|nr:hypothetical protein CHX27_08550 [Flavobacterium aurantiibacter]